MRGTVTPTAARSLIMSQFPDLAPVRVAVLGDGWDNTAYRVNDDWVFRFPRREMGSNALEAEIRVMPGLAPRLPLPVPVVDDERGWYFDTEEGIEEILDRRVGRNELATIQVCLAYIDAQREYYSADRDGDELLEYAQQKRFLLHLFTNASYLTEEKVERLKKEGKILAPTWMCRGLSLRSASLKDGGIGGLRSGWVPS